MCREIIVQGVPQKPQLNRNKVTAVEILLFYQALTNSFPAIYLQTDKNMHGIVKLLS